MTAGQCQHFSVQCPSRLLFDQIADKWSMMVLTVLDDGPLRFNAVKRQLEGVTQKALTQCLRRLERRGRSSTSSRHWVARCCRPCGRSTDGRWTIWTTWMRRGMRSTAGPRLDETGYVTSGGSKARAGPWPLPAVRYWLRYFSARRATPSRVASSVPLPLAFS